MRHVIIILIVMFNFNIIISSCAISNLFSESQKHKYHYYKGKLPKEQNLKLSIDECYLEINKKLNTGKIIFEIAVKNEGKKNAKFLKYDNFLHLFNHTELESGYFIGPPFYPKLSGKGRFYREEEFKLILLKPNDKVHFRIVFTEEELGYLIKMDENQIIQAYYRNRVDKIIDEPIWYGYILSPVFSVNFSNLSKKFVD